MNWDDIPSAEEVEAALNDLATKRAELRVAELELEIAQSEVSVLSPRNKAARIIGVDAQSREKLFGLQNQVLVCKERVENAEAQVTLNKHRIDMAKALSFRGRW